MLFEDLVAAVKGQAAGGLDVTDAVAGGWVNEAHKEVVAESGWMMAVETLATTVAGQAAYDVPDNIADVRSIMITDATGLPADWQPKSLEDIWGLQRGVVRLVGSGGVFAATAKADGTKQVQLFPVPSTSGVAITALVSLIPVDLVNGMQPVIPVDMHGKLLDAAIALGLLRVENRPDLAQAFDARKEQLKDLLRRRKNSRMGSTPTRMQVEGHDF